MEEALKKLIGYTTIQGNDKAIVACYGFIAKVLSWYPFKVRKYMHNDVRSVVWSTEPGVVSDIILSAHIDVVPGCQQLFTLKTKRGRWLGRGVSDMKYAIPVFNESLRTLWKKNKKLPSVAIMLTGDEEIGGKNGVGYLVNTVGYRAKIIVCPDGGDNWKIVEQAKGALHVEVCVRGKSCHGSRPWDGISANDILLRKLLRLREYYPESTKETWNTTLTIGVIQGGLQTNQVASSAIARLDFRYPPGIVPEDIKKRVEQVFGVSNVTILSNASIYKTDRNNSYVRLWEQEVRSIARVSRIYTSEYGASDARFFSAVGIPAIVSKPKGGDIHTDREWIDIVSVKQYTKVLTKFMDRVSDVPS